MENESGLLVALMFVTILTMGIGNLLVFLSQKIQQAGWPRQNPLQTVWLLILLLISFDMFWHALNFLTVENWSFPGFLYVVSGASVLFFVTTNIPTLDGQVTTEDRESITRSNRLFFILLACFLVWLTLLIHYFDGTDSIGLLARMVCIGVLILMMFVPSPRIYRTGTTVAGICVALLLASEAFA